MRFGPVLLVLVVACSGGSDARDPGPVPGPADSATPPPDAAPAPDAAPGFAPVTLRLAPEGRFALATGESLALHVDAVDAAGAARDVTAGAEIEVRNPADDAEIVTGLDPTLLANFDDFIFKQLPKYDVKVELMLLGAAHATECTSPSPIPVGPARTALLDKAVRPFVARYDGSPWVWGIDLMNEPEGAVAGPTGNWATGTDWDTMRGFLAEGAALVRGLAPRLYVSSGSGWHDAENVQAGRFSGLGFTHLDFHSYNDGGDLPDYPSLWRHARILVGEAGQGSDRYDDAQQAATLGNFLEAAAGESYWGVLAWAIDHPGSEDHLSLLTTDSTYATMRARPAAGVLLDFTRGRGDIGP